MSDREYSEKYPKTTTSAAFRVDAPKGGAVPAPNTYDYQNEIEKHPDWVRLMDKEIVALVVAGKAKMIEAARFVFARKMRKYS